MDQSPHGNFDRLHFDVDAVRTRVGQLTDIVTAESAPLSSATAVVCDGEAIIVVTGEN